MPTRRDTLQLGTAGLFATGLFATGLAVQPRPARAQASAPNVHRFKVGTAEVMVLSDGYMMQQVAMFGTDRTEAERVAAFKAAGTTEARVRASVNVTLVRQGSDLTLIDVGAGANFMDTTGKLGDALTAAGVDPAAVTRVIITHGHPDHLWGAVDEFDDSVRFGKARHIVSEAEWALWMTGDPSAKLPADRQNFIPGAKRNLARIKDQTTFVKSGADLGGGLAAVDTAGHTQGHMSVMIGSGSETAMVLADALIHPAVSLAHPDWKVAADHDPDRAVATRKALLDRLATDKTLVVGYHFPFPGVGRIERRGQAYIFQPSA
jgi:glyoxylase-like metal-dependent hydrolase (beta-lactamase superfamily II)